MTKYFDAEWTMAQLQMEINNRGFADLICQTEIKEEDKKKEGYFIPFTLEEFREKVPNVDPACIWYGPALSCMCVYFNRSTMAAVNFPIFAYQEDQERIMSNRMIRNFPEAMATAEAAAADGDILRGGMVFTGRMRLEYIVECIRKGFRAKRLYKNVLDLMAYSDFGFGDFPQDVFQIVMDAKTEEDRANTAASLAGFPDEVTIYRGGNTQSTPAEKAYYWSTDPNVAIFFACRLGMGPGYFATATVRKEDILEYDPKSPEEDVLVFPQNVRNIQIRTLHGAGYLEAVVPNLSSDYFDALDEMNEVTYRMPDSSPHGPTHSRRVLLLCLILAREAGLSKDDIRVLQMAAVYHDCERDNDDVDLEHGFYSAHAYEESADEPDPLVSAICEFHCRPDEDFEKIIQERAELRSQKDRALKLFRYFKDADALDLTRFGIRALDYTMLRTKEAKVLPLAACLMQP